MAMTRREFLALSAAGAGYLVLSRTGLARVIPDPQPEFFDWKAAGSAATAAIAFGQGGNSLLLIGPDSSLLVDCKNAPVGTVLRREALARGHKLALVINTHHHADHTGGNHAFTKDTPVLAHENAKPRIAPQMSRYISQAKEAMTGLAQAKGPAGEEARREALAFYRRIEEAKAEDFEPTQTCGDRRDLNIAGEKVVLYHFGPGHTDNDLVVHIPGRNLVHCGDLLFHKNHPFMDRDAGGNSKGWMESVRKIIALCDDKTVVIPGHGELTDTSGLRQQIDYFEQVRAALAKALKDGKPRAEAQKIELPQFKDYGLQQIREMTFAAIYQELQEEQGKTGGTK